MKLTQLTCYFSYSFIYNAIGASFWTILVVALNQMGLTLKAFI